MKVISNDLQNVMLFVLCEKLMIYSGWSMSNCT